MFEAVEMISTNGRTTTPEKKVRRTKGVQSVERALSILDAFIGNGGSHSLTELARSTKLVKPTVLRSLVSLENFGYVIRTVEGRYELAGKTQELAAAYAKVFKIEDRVLPVLRDLAHATGESASFHIRENDQRLCLFRVESPQTVRDVPDTAGLKSIDQTATGRVLAETHHPSAGEQKRIVYSSHGINDSQIASLSTPVFGFNSNLVGALTVSGPVTRFTLKQKKEMMHVLGQAADGLSATLGAQLAFSSVVLDSASERQT